MTAWILMAISFAQPAMISSNLLAMKEFRTFEACQKALKTPSELHAYCKGGCKITYFCMEAVK